MLFTRFVKTGGAYRIRNRDSDCSQTVPTIGAGNLSAIQCRRIEVMREEVNQVCLSCRFCRERGTAVVRDGPYHAGPTTEHNY